MAETITITADRNKLKAIRKYCEKNDLFLSRFLIDTAFDWIWEQEELR